MLPGLCLSSGGSLLFCLEQMFVCTGVCEKPAPKRASKCCARDGVQKSTASCARDGCASCRLIQVERTDTKAAGVDERDADAHLALAPSRVTAVVVPEFARENAFASFASHLRREPPGIRRTLPLLI
jgi:hypothetical protein